MISSMPMEYQQFKDLEWEQIAPFYRDLVSYPMAGASLSSVQGLLSEWSALKILLEERYWRCYVASTVDTTDAQAQKDYAHFLDEIYPPSQVEEQKLKTKLLESGLQPPGLEVALQNLRWEAEIYREKNIPLLSEEFKLSTEYDRVVGAQTIVWEGKELTLTQLQPVYQRPEREVREDAWRMAARSGLEDRQTLNELWGRFMQLRLQITHNAGLPGFRDYTWKKLLRFDYSPQDCRRFHNAIEQVVVPVAQQIYEKRRKRLGVQSVRPWDLEVDPFNRPALRPFHDVQQLESKTANIFQRVDPQLGQYFHTMRQESLLDLDNRKGKAPGAYCVTYRSSQRAFIFANSVGMHDDVQTLLHEGGHAFHVFETNHLPYHLQMIPPMEFAEVASTAMEFLGAPYLAEDQGGFYSQADAARARIEHLERLILFWPYMAVVDAFQHWVYENPSLASDPQHCDQTWSELWHRFMLGVDWSGLEDEMATGWQRKLHIFEVPFYYIEYGLAQLGAVQVWRNALQDQAQAVAAYRQGLALGGMARLPALFAAAGGEFSFEPRVLQEAVELMMTTIEQLEQA